MSVCVRACVCACECVGISLSLCGVCVCVLVSGLLATPDDTHTSTFTFRHIRVDEGG